MKIRHFLFVLLFLMATRLFAQSVVFEPDWSDYFKSIQNGPITSDGLYRCQQFIDLENQNVDAIVSNVEWEIISDTAEIRVLSDLPQFSGLEVKLFPASYQTGIFCQFYPYQVEAGIFSRIKRFSVLLSPKPELKTSNALAEANTSVLATGKWIKVSVSEKGIYKISYDQLKELGIKTPEKVGIYGNGGSELPKMNQTSYPDDPVLNPVYHGTDSNGKTCVFFYAPGTSKLVYDPSTKRFKHSVNSFSDLSYYYITCDAEPSPVISTAPVYDGVPEMVHTTYDAYRFFEEEVNSPMKSGRKLYGKLIKTSSRSSFTLECSNVLADQEATLTLAGAGRSSGVTYFEVYVDGVYKDQISFNPVETTSEYAIYASHVEKSWTIKAKDKTEISVNYLAESIGGDGWLDFISINAKAKLVFSGNSLHFRNSSDNGYKLVKYTIEGLPATGKIWDVSDPLVPLQVVSASPQNQGNVSFLASGGKIREYIAFNPLASQIPEPVFVEDIDNQNIKGNPVPELLIVTHPDFLAAANELAEHRRTNDGLSVLVVTTKQVYNEFSSGIADVTSIRNLARYFYKKNASSSQKLQYLLLMGDGLYNNRSELSFIPTYQSENSLYPIDSYVTDDFFGLLDENEGETTGYLDIGVGRLTCKTINQANAIVSKIIGYDSSEARGVWRNKICFIADDEDSNIHMSDTEKLIDTVNAKYPGFYADKIYFDAYRQVSSSDGDKYPEVTEAINRRVKEGVLILNYMGHANSSSLAHEDVLEISHINSWNNMKSLPVFVTATCEFSQFDDNEDSAGELILSNPNGGGVALFTTTRVVYSANNYRLSNNFYNSIFDLDEKGEKLRLGEVMRRAKNNTLHDTNKFSFVLLADPSMRLAFPKYRVKTTAINGVPVGQGTVTIGALEKVSIKGVVTDESDQTLNTFNGEVSTMLYDKEMSIETYANDGGIPFEFKVRNNLIYKGISSVVNGEFELSFIVPKDISYQIGEGKIYYYATNESEDANGSSTGIKIGGTGVNTYVENTPPEIQLFINDETFKPYDKVASSALLMVKLYDETGINTVGAGIGHDLIGVLDGDYSNQLVLNDYYTSKQNSFQEGTILYPLNNLAPGEHTILVKVWDVQNNSTEKEVHFIVENGFKVYSVNNYPNPVVSSTNFSIKHNLPGEVLDAKVELFALNGQKVYEMDESVASSGGVVSYLKWNTNRLTQPLKINQILVYRIILTSPSGDQATGTGKLYLKKQSQ